MPSATFTVVGMTCGHCVMSVKREVGAIEGVTEIEVNLASGALTIDSEAPLDAEKVRAAVEEAGYELEDPTPITRLNLLGASSGGGCNCGCGGH